VLEVSEVWLEKARFMFEPLLVEIDEEACHVEEDCMGNKVTSIIVILWENIYSIKRLTMSALTDDPGLS
jgi:hypothetical protein